MGKAERLMLTSDEKRMLNSISKSLQDLVKILGTMNDNLVLIGRDLVPPRTAMAEQQAVTIAPTPRFKEGDRIVVVEKSSAYYGFQGVFGMVFSDHSVVVQLDKVDEPKHFYHTHIDHVPLSPGDYVKVINKDAMGVGEVGKVKLIGDMVEVKFASGSGGEYFRQSLESATKEDYEADVRKWAEIRLGVHTEGRCVRALCAYCQGDVSYDANQLEIPNIVAVENEDGSTTYTKHPEDLGVDAESYTLLRGDGSELFKKYIPDAQGRLKPYEWRHNLGLETFYGDDVHENEQMTEEAFRIYDAGLNPKENQE